MIRPLLFCLLLLLTACQNKPEPASFSGNAMTIGYRILIGKQLSDQESRQVQELIQEVFSEVNTIYNNWNPYSEISQLNRLPAKEKRLVSEPLYNFLTLTAELVELTDGRFDPTVYPLHKLWISYLKQGLTPPADEIAAASQLVGWDKIHLENGFFSKDYQGTSLDLGGIAKGYAVDLIVERLAKEGFTDAYVEWGGEIRTSGSHPSGRPWSILISALADNDPTKAAAQLQLHDKAVATSGDYIQYWQTFSGEVYFHIINPRTLTPLSIHPHSIASVSVIADSCMLADALATAGMTFDSVEEAKELQERQPNVEFIFIKR